MHQGDVMATNLPSKQHEGAMSKTH